MIVCLRVVSWARDFLEEWKIVHCVVNTKSKELDSDLCKWKPSEEGFFKIDSDAATDYKNRLIGFGVIIRDGSGQVKFAAAQNVKAMWSPLVAEAMAVKRGILMALDSGLMPVQVETDSLQLVKLISNGVI
ncbi:hypothetical protein Dsin_019066 [Dipteronia sinensis]|uniref:RNase H type-1 domain-containing protein n=1 Tax=Dipteronia sinensis TaxID=43782 RepID=A0AAE0A6H6_9ROSI|nr:hypothetical protein Dsin_019066 [Dipteronia sinensis]